ncbi:MAG TPA: hypothetical protein VJV78_03615 [Polyangiales bacterium]|nr:hypothetical protein [Polyangiales bacterium]
MLRNACSAVLFGFFSLGFAACGDDLDGESLIGATCKEQEDCDVTGVCITSGKDGMCSMECDAPGAPQQCPLGAYCDTVHAETNDDLPADMTLCLPACSNKDDCRSGYECTGVSSGSGKVCKPKD